MKRLKLLLVTATAAMSVLAAAPVASADTLCASATAYTQNHEFHFLRYTWTYKSYWELYTPYEAYRYRPDGTIAYWYVKAGGGKNTFTNGTTNAWRETAIYENDSAYAQYTMSQWAYGGTSCT